ncbi:MAG: hypothetical protein BWY88_01369 [Synergistetes bacterium ADurb.Bin520]|nr:MAG: hypothetical protein BWY88_01369 [Synergistetes bacterium ADurb.Bin520]
MIMAKKKLKKTRKKKLMSTSRYPGTVPRKLKIG